MVEKKRKNGSSDICYIDFQFSHPELDPLTIGLALGLEPFELNKKGDKVEIHGVGTVKHGGSFWSWSTRDRVLGSDLNEHLEYLFATLVGKESALSQLQQQGWETRLACYLYPGSETSRTGADFSRATIEKISMLQAELVFKVRIVHPPENKK